MSRFFFLSRSDYVLPLLLVQFSPYSLTGDDGIRKKLGFLALAFRDFDVNKNNTIQLEGFRRALSYYQFLEEEQSDSLENYLDSEFRISWVDAVDQCFEVTLLQ